MASVTYLVGGESPTAARMNALFAALDGKLSTMLGGKSFLLAQAGTFPKKLCGKIFFFTSGTTLYAQRAPGNLNGSGQPIAYNHAPFVQAMTDYAGYWDWRGYFPGMVDAVNKVMRIDELPSYFASLGFGYETGAYGQYAGCLFDWSLEAHHWQFQETVGGPYVKYYPQEYYQDGSDPPSTAPLHAPEKRLAFALAEIVIEGPTSVALPANYDKYNFFRIHNLNHASATVNFASGAATVTIPALSCVCVRRDGPVANYRTSPYTYFFQFEPGDYRFYWFMPSIFDPDNPNHEKVAEGARASNSMQANNLTNPACLLDWVQFFCRDMTQAGAPNNWYAGWVQDPSVQCDVYALNAGKFGDPSNNATLLGDLLHHKGDILIKRTLHASPYTVTWDKVTFNGYGTIVADFAAHQLTVAENGNGDLTISNADAANHVDLIPVGTNMLKSFSNGSPAGVESHPSSIGLDTPFTIENAIFEAPDYKNLSATAPQVVIQPSLSSSANSQTWYDAGGNPHGVTGPNIQTLDWTHTRGTSKTIHAIHRTTVADILAMDWWGDPTFGNQNSTYVTISNRKLQLTPEGLVLTYSETRSNITPSNLGTQIYFDWCAGKYGFPISKAIQFRSHGWGYVSAENGSRDTGFLSPRYGRFLTTGNVVGEIVAPGGSDFSFPSLSATQSQVAVLTRVRPVDLGHPWGGRFWQTGAPGGDGLTSGTIAMGLLPEMYNSMARAVNALITATPLSYKTLRWMIGGNLFALGTDFGDAGWATPDAAVVDRGSYNAATDTPSLGSLQVAGNMLTVSVAGGTYKVGDRLYYNGSFWANMGTNYPPSAFTMNGIIKPMAALSWVLDGSPLAQVCAALGIPLQSTIPGGIGSDGTPQTFDYFLGKCDVSGSWHWDLATSVSGVSITDIGGTPYHTYHASATLTPSLSISVPTAAAIISGGGWTPSYGYVSSQGISLTSLLALKWIALSDVKTVVEALGFKFAFSEVVAPLALTYFENPVVADTTYILPPSTFTKNLTPDPSGEGWSMDAPTNQSLMSSAPAKHYVGGGPWEIPAAKLAFCRTASASEALWKCTPGKLSSTGGTYTTNVTAPAVLSTVIRAWSANSPFYKGVTGLMALGLNYSYGPPSGWSVDFGTTPASYATANYIAMIDWRASTTTAAIWSKLLQSTYAPGYSASEDDYPAVNICASTGIQGSTAYWVGVGRWSIVTDCFTSHANPATYGTVIGPGYQQWTWLSAPANKATALSNGLNILAAETNNSYAICVSSLGCQVTLS